MSVFTTEQIARVCHDANRAYCETIGDNSQKSWAEAEQWQRNSAVNGVSFALSHPDSPASSQHEAWLRDKVSDGWVNGPVKDFALKTHPCIVPYDQLPIEQRMKDYLFKAVVAAFIQGIREA